MGTIFPRAVAVVKLNNVSPLVTVCVFSNIAPFRRLQLRDFQVPSQTPLQPAGSLVPLPSREKKTCHPTVVSISKFHLSQLVSLIFPCWLVVAPELHRARSLARTEIKRSPCDNPCVTPQSLYRYICSLCGCAFCVETEMDDMQELTGTDLADKPLGESQEGNNQVKPGI